MTATYTAPAGTPKAQEMFKLGKAELLALGTKPAKAELKRRQVNRANKRGA